MLPWIQVYSNLADHPKIYALVDRMKLRRNSEAVGIVVSLWLWAAKNAPDGDLSGFPERAIADAVGYPSSYAGKLCELLLECRWLDEKEGGGYQIHDWEAYAGMLMDALERQMEKSRERQKRYRMRKKQISVDGDADDNVTRNVTHNATRYATNVTRYAPTRPDLTKPEQIIISHQSPSWSKSKLISLFSPKLQLKESVLDELLSLVNGMEEGLLLKSLDIAQDNGKLNWGYVRGILKNWQRNGVKTMREFEEREARRKVNQSGGNPSISATAAQDVAESRRRMEQLREELNGEGP